MAHILIVDDSEVFCAIAAKVFQEMGHIVDVAYSLASGAQALSPEHDVVFLDVSLPDGNGIEAMAAFSRTPVPPEIIVITASADPDGAAEAVGSGAWDYVEKEASLEKLRQALLLALRHRRERHQDKPRIIHRRGIIGKSPRLMACLETMARAAATGANILISGETGTGKELFAQAVHQNSSRRGAPFVVMDCGSIPLQLVESTLFGHVRGAFTGADKDAPGLLRLADGGTLFLDEVGELPLEMQRGFLRALQERRYRPVGSDVELESDFRLVAATNKDLASMVPTGEFRSDLLYRLNVVEVRLPALRERPCDIPLLARFVLDRVAAEETGTAPELSREFLDALAQYNWPGNVRELFNAMETACINAFGAATLYPKHLPGYIRQHLVRRAVASLHPEAEAAAPDAEKKTSWRPWKQQRNVAVATAAKSYFTSLLRQVSGDVGQACRIACLSQQHLYAMLKKYDIATRDWRDS